LIHQAKETLIKWKKINNNHKDQTDFNEDQEINLVIGCLELLMDGRVSSQFTFQPSKKKDENDVLMGEWEMGETITALPSLDWSIHDNQHTKLMKMRQVARFLISDGSHIPLLSLSLPLLSRGFFSHSHHLHVITSSSPPPWERSSKPIQPLTPGSLDELLHLSLSSPFPSLRERMLEVLTIEEKVSHFSQPPSSTSTLPSLLQVEMSPSDSTLSLSLNESLLSLLWEKDVSVSPLLFFLPHSLSYGFYHYSVQEEELIPSYLSSSYPIPSLTPLTPLLSIFSSSVASYLIPPLPSLPAHKFHLILNQDDQPSNLDLDHIQINPLSYLTPFQSTSSSTNPIIRIGFISSHFYDCSSGRLASSFIQKIRMLIEEEETFSHIELVGLSYPTVSDKISKIVQTSVHSLVNLIPSNM